MQGLSKMTERRNLCISSIEKGTKIHSKSTEKFSEIIPEYFPNLGKEIKILVQEVFKTPKQT
jgi:hypothetical protein